MEADGEICDAEYIQSIVWRSPSGRKLFDQAIGNVDDILGLTAKSLPFKPLFSTLDFAA